MWDIKYRPKKFADVLGQEGNVRLLKARLARGTAFDTSYLFKGGHGQGKTTLARIHARAMLCQALDKNNPEPCNECENCRACAVDQSEAFSERDAASQGKIENIRSLVEKLGFAVGSARMRIELFDEAHRIGDGAQDVLLKPLEEKKLVGMFCTTEPNKIKGTIRTRCEEYDIRKVTREDVLARARFVCQSEGVKAEDDALLTIIDSSGGHIRDILNKMEMVAQIGDINLENTREYLHLGAITVYYDILLSLNDAPRVIELIERACENVAPEDVVSGIAEAAMNSYRLAKGMYAEFVFVDRDLGKRVFDRYGLGCLRLAEFFLQNRYASRVSLMRDAMLLTQLPGNLPPEGALPTLYLVAPGAVVNVGAGAVVQRTTGEPISSEAIPPVAVPTQIASSDGNTTRPQVSTPAAAAHVAAAPAVVLNGHGAAKSEPPDPPLHGFGPTFQEWREPRMRNDSTSVPPGQVHQQGRNELEAHEWQRLFLIKWYHGHPERNG